MNPFSFFRFTICQLPIVIDYIVPIEGTLSHMRFANGLKTHRPGLYMLSNLALVRPQIISMRINVCQSFFYLSLTHVSFAHTSLNGPLHFL